MIIKSNNVYKVNAERTEHPYQYVVTYVKAASIEDVINNEPIYSKLMLSFITEQFNIGLVEGVLRQRLLISTIKELLEEKDSLENDNKSFDYKIDVAEEEIDKIEEKIEKNQNWKFFHIH